MRTNFVTDSYCVECQGKITPSDIEWRKSVCRFCRSKIRNCSVCNIEFLGLRTKCDICYRHPPDKSYIKPYGIGRYTDVEGYIMVKCPQDHPRCYINNYNRKRRYIQEHTLVMEKVLGRFLFPDENVHHINGIRNDNRPENLELWIKPHPTGIRKEDAIAWAKEILARYECEIL